MDRIAANHVRRASYGPNSPVVGERGARTRRAIVDAALVSFQAKGLHATSVDDIADAAGLSRAALYQYFESKDQLVVELVREAAADLLRVIRRLGPIGPTTEGYDNLHWWLGEWAWVQDKYQALYLQWTVVDTPGASLRPLMAEYIVSYVSSLAPRLAAALGDGELDVDATATVLLPLLFKVNEYRQQGIDRGLGDDELLDALATFVQLALFPSTPPGAIPTGDAPGATPAAPATPSPPPRPQPGPGTGAVPATGGPASATVQRLLDAGAAAFGAQGFHATSVQDVLSAAGAGRGTFYRHFADKTDLLVALSRDSLNRLEELAARLGEVIADDDRPGALRRWLEECLDLHRRYRGVFRALLEEGPRHPPLDELRQRSGTTILRTFDDALATVGRRHPFDVRVGSLVLLALLERGPGYVFGTPYDLDDARIVEVLATLVERGLLDDG